MIDKLAYDPVATQNLVVNRINDESGFEMLDPTNSFTMLLEASTISSVSALSELLAAEREIFSSLAATAEDLFGHMIDYDERNFFASPADTIVRMKISVDSILKYGVQDPSQIYTVMIPKNSSMVVDGVELTIMDDVKITLNTQGNKYRTFIENIITKDSIYFKNIGNLRSGIEVDDENVAWVIFDLPVLQVEQLEVVDVVSLGMEYTLEIPLNDSYYFSNISYIDALGNEVIVTNVFTDTKFNPDELSVYIKVGDDKVTYKIPQIYIDNRMISGTIKISLYTTKGKIQMSLGKFLPTDYSFNISRDTPTLEKAASLKLNYLLSSTAIMNGGVNARPLRDMKKRIIYRATGNNDIPITEKQLEEHARLQGFTLFKITDTLTGRLFIASRDMIEQSSSSDVPATIDLFNNSVSISAEPSLASSGIDITPSTVLIKPGTIFEDKNGIVSPIPDSLNVLSTLSNKKLIEYMNDNKILHTPFLTIVENDISSTTSRVYDIDNARMDFVTIEAKNQFLRENVNINGYNMFRVEDGYDIFFRLLGNANYDAIASNVKIQLRLSATDESEVFYHSTIDAAATTARFGADTDPLHYIHIDSNFNIDKRDKISLQGGVSLTAINPIDISTIGDITIYHTDTSIVVPGEVQSNALLFISDNNTVINDGINPNPVGMTKESIQIRFADNLEYLWRRTFLAYNERAYKRYDTDIPLTYKENVYADGSCGVEIVTDPNTGNCVSTNLTPMHNVGDPVLDTNGDPIMEFKAGDVMLDTDGNPMIDSVNGLTRQVDLLMLEHMFKVVKKDKYKNHIDTTVDLIRDWVLNKMVSLNDIVLEQTSVLFKPNRSNSSVSVEGLTSTNEISPTVTMYLRSYADGSSIDVSKAYNDIGVILSRYFNKKYIVIKDLEAEIQRLFSDIGAVKVSNYIGSDPLIIDIDHHSRFAIKKKISADFDILYDFELEIK